MSLPIYCPRCGSILSNKYEGGKQRPACDSPGCGYFHFTDVSIGCGAVVIHEGRALLIQRGLEPGRGNWQIPGGYVEDDEEIASAVEREVFEEAGIKANVEKVIGFRHSANLNGLSSPNLYVVFRLKHLSGEPRFDGEETIDAGYFSMSEIENKQGIQTLSLWAIKLAFTSDRNMGFVSQDSFFEPRAGRTVFGIES